MVDAAAVLGQRIPFDWLASVTGLGEDVLIGILREPSVGGSSSKKRCRRVLVPARATREAVTGRLLAHERRRLHEKSLAALQEAGSDDWATLAHHAAGAGRWEEMIAAARQGASQYLRTGATYQALRLAELALSEADADLEVLELATRAAWSVGLPVSALERCEQWRRLAEESADPADLPWALRVLARLRWEGGDAPGHRAAVEAARLAAERLPEGEERAWVANLLAESAMLAGRTEESIRWADEALAMAGPNPSPALRAAVLVNKGPALQVLPATHDEGQRLLLEGQEAAVLAEDYLSALRSVNNLAHNVLPVWPPARSAGLLERMGEWIDRSGRQDWVGTWHQLRSTFFAHVLGDLPRARTELEPVAVTGIRRPWVAILSAELALEAGEDDRADALLATVATPSEFTDASEYGVSLGMQVRLAARRRSLATAERLLDELADEMARLDDQGRLSLSDAWHHALVLALHGGLEGSVARATIARAGPPVVVSGNFVDPSWPDHLSGALAEAEGEVDVALTAYQAALADRGWRRSPPAAADARLGAARCLLALGRRDDARDHALAAMTLLEHWPGWRRDDAALLLRRLGSGSPAARSGSGELTAREHEVAELLATGLSNGEIAARLYISTKTASVHVSNILRKLNMGSRAEVAAWVVREQLQG